MDETVVDGGVERAEEEQVVTEPGNVSTKLA